MYPSFEQRRNRTTAVVPELKFMTLSDMLQKPIPLSSEERLADLRSDSWKPSDFVAACKALQDEAGLSVRIVEDGRVPNPGPDVIYKYVNSAYIDVPHRVAEGEAVVLAVVAEGPRV